MGKAARLRNQRKAQRNYNERRVDYRIERHDDYTVASWIDPRLTAEDVDGRVRQYLELADERRAESDMEGYGFRSYNQSENRVYDYTFDTEEASREFLLKGRYPEMPSDSQDTGKNGLSFPSIGVSNIDANDPRNEKYIKLAFDLIQSFRRGEISQSCAQFLAAVYIEPYKYAA